jgi:NADH pyrophosphatase NudC (nudix superfamily)
MSRLLTDLRQGHAVASVQEQQVILVADELQLAEAALRRWAEDHRVCPTCGGTLDPARVAEHTRLHGGGSHA